MTDVIKRKSRKRLTDLFVVGKEVEFDDGDGAFIKLWVQKLTEPETKQAIDAARPAKSKITAYKKLDEDDPRKMVFYDQLDKNELTDKDSLISFIIADKVVEATMSAEEEIKANDEWAKEDYLEGLQKAWEDELEEVWLEDQENEEAKTVYEELKRFTEQVHAEIKAARNELVYEIQDYSYEALRKKAVNKLIDKLGDQELVDEYRKQQLFLAVRLDDNHNERYFESREELNKLSPTVFNKLMITFIEISIDSFEGKESQEVQSS